MTSTPLQPPTLDPTPIFEHFRGSYATELLTAAVAHFDVFSHFSEGRRRPLTCRSVFGLRFDRPAVVLFTALRAFTERWRRRRWPAGTVGVGPRTFAARRPVPTSDYLGLAADSPGRLAEMVERRGDYVQTAAGWRQASPETGAAFIASRRASSRQWKQEAAGVAADAGAGGPSEKCPESLTEPRFRRPKRVLARTWAAAPACMLLPRRSKRHSLHCVRYQVWDRPQVLKIVAEFAQQPRHRRPPRMSAGRHVYRDPVSTGADAVLLLSNVLHDWDVRCNAASWSGCRADALAVRRRATDSRRFSQRDAHYDGPLPTGFCTRRCCS